ncbi:MAG: hypothetical protein MUP45_01230 [Candidatus Marinimicrobia bacterium]|nr:hypothetical protein [Candidatus Neomarinimicrobiota bacterium]
MEPKVLFRGPVHSCQKGPHTITYGRIASIFFIEPYQAGQLLGISDDLSVFVQPAEELWPNEEKEPRVFEVAIVPKCGDGNFPQTPEPKDLEWLFAKTRTESLWAIEETTHPQLTCKVPIQSSPPILTHNPKTKTIGLGITGFFADHVVQVIAQFIPGAKMEGHIFHLPNECVLAEIRKDLHSPFVTIMNKNGNPLVLFHEGPQSHVHFFRDEFQPVVEAFDQYLKELEQESDEMMGEIGKIANDFPFNLIQ